MKRPTPIDEEVLFDGRSLISEADTKGIITFVNRKFTKMTLYAAEEAVGQPHSLLRHPDMPKAAFKEMWDVIQSGKAWEGYVKNLRKDGRYYWVVVSIIPKVDEKGAIVGYIASRKMPDRNYLQNIITQYQRMLAAER